MLVSWHQSFRQQHLVHPSLLEVLLVDAKHQRALTSLHAHAHATSRPIDPLSCLPVGRAHQILVQRELAFSMPSYVQHAYQPQGFRSSCWTPIDWRRAHRCKQLRQRRTTLQLRSCHPYLSRYHRMCSERLAQLECDRAVDQCLPRCMLW